MRLLERNILQKDPLYISWVRRHTGYINITRKIKTTNYKIIGVPERSSQI